MPCAIIIEYRAVFISDEWINEGKRRRRKKRFLYSAAGSYAKRLAILNSMPIQYALGIQNLLIVKTRNNHKSQQWQLNKLWAFGYRWSAHSLYWTWNTASVIEITNNITFEHVFFCRMLGVIWHRSEIRSEKKNVELIIEKAYFVWLSWNLKCTISVYIHIFRCIYIMPLSGVPFAIPFGFDDFFFVLPLFLSYLFVWKMIQFPSFIVGLCVILLNLHSQVAITLWPIQVPSFFILWMRWYVVHLQFSLNQFHHTMLKVSSCNVMGPMWIRRLEQYNENNHFSLPVFFSSVSPLICNVQIKYI